MFLCASQKKKRQSKSQNNKPTMYGLAVLDDWQEFLELRHMSSPRSVIWVTAAACAVTQQEDGRATAVSQQNVTCTSF